MDEIGRGTSTYDGLSLAWACADYLAQQLKAMTLFATHYFELTELASQLQGLANIHLDAVEHDEHIVFMHQVQDGAASKSYGLQVAQLAGVPRVVIQKAKQKLTQLEQQSLLSAKAPAVVKTAEPLQQQLFVEAEPHPILDQLAKLDPDQLSARQALDLLYQLKASL